MFRVAIAIVRDPALAEDVVQDSIIKVWNNLATFRGESSLRSWILRITHNTAVSTLRRVRDDAWDPSTLPERPTDARIEAVVEAREELDELKAALNQLDGLSRSILALREVEGMAYADIAESLGVTVGLVKIRLLRARRALAASVRGTR